MPKLKRLVRISFVNRGVASFAAALAVITAGTGTRSISPALASPSDGPLWSAKGVLLESCTCAVPCTCNFGRGPSPGPSCNAVYAYRLDKASWKGVDLSGLMIAGADGPNGSIDFVDAKATPAQKAALENLGAALFELGGPVRIANTWTTAALTCTVSGNRFELNITGRGGFAARLLIGRDGTNPIVVENNTTWPVERVSKGYSLHLDFRDTTVGSISGQNTNANYGAFTLSGSDDQ